MVYYSPQASFNKGELSPVLGSRSDIDFWQSSLKECTNFNVLVQGGLRRRSGTVFVAEVRDSSERARILPFTFSSTQSYILSLNNGYIRFLADRAVVASGGSTYEVAHPWSASHLTRLSTTQANDVMYVAHKSYKPRKISRVADDDWTIAEHTFKDGPYLSGEFDKTTTLRPAETGAVHPKMTSATAPSGSTSASTGTNAWQVFDRATTGYWNAGTSTGTIEYDFDGSTEKVCDAYWIQAIGFGGAVAPTTWSFEGYDGAEAAWVVLDTRQAETGWSRGEKRFYEFTNSTAFQKYRIVIDGSEDINDLYVSEMGWHESGDTQTPFNLTASSTSEINDGAGFQGSDVGRTIRIMGSDNKWRWCVITERTSTTVVKVRMYGHALPDLTRISRWQMGAFSDESGWPGSVELYDERLTWARTDTEPTTLFMSKQAEFEEYGVSDPVVATDAVKLTILTSDMNEILWVCDNGDLFVGTSKQLRAVGPADITQAFSATNLAQRKGPTSGAAPTRPIAIGSVLIYVSAGGIKIREMVPDGTRYVAPELSVMGEHLLKSGVVSWAFSDSPDPILYIVNGDGDLVAMTYDRDQKVVAFARHEIADAVVEDVAVIAGIESGYDDVYIVARRTIDGSTKRYIEVLEKPFDPESDDINDAFFVDCGLSYSGSAISTVTGLDHLEGKTVRVLADGGVVRGLVVSGGEITLPAAASNIKVGLPFESRAQTLPVSGPQQDGSLFGRRVNALAPKVDVYGAGSLEVGNGRKDGAEDDWVPPMYEQILPRGDEMFGNSVSLRTGFIDCQIEGSWADDGSFVMATDEPLPLIIRSTVLMLEGEP